MVELGRDGDLAEEPLGAERVGKFRVEDLDRHLTVVLEIVGEVDGGHAALAELALEQVTVAQSIGEWRADCGHESASRETTGMCRTGPSIATQVPQVNRRGTSIS